MSQSSVTGAVSKAALLQHNSQARHAMRALLPWVLLGAFAGSTEQSSAGSHRASSVVAVGSQLLWVRNSKEGNRPRFMQHHCCSGSAVLHHGAAFQPVPTSAARSLFSTALLGLGAGGGAQVREFRCYCFPGLL